MQNRFKFTIKELKAIELPPDGKRTSYYDTERPSLTLLVSSTGTKTFYVYRRVNGKPERIKIGKFPLVTIDQARLKADDINGQIASGNNPNDIRRTERAESTLATLFDEYLENYAKPFKRTWRTDEQQFNLHLKKLRNRKLSDIKRNDIKDLHQAIGKEEGSIYAANRIIALLKKVFNYGIEEGIHKGDNPCRGIKLFKEEARKRFLQSDELARFFQAVSEEENETIRDYVLISLLTGARRSNVLSMHWDEINLTLAEWTIPADKFKNAEQHTIPLVQEAIELLQHRKQHIQPGNEWVFPGAGKTGHLVEPKKAWARILQRAGIGGLRLHDLRRSLGSWQAMTGTSLLIIGSGLGHRDLKTTQRNYAHVNNDPIRQAMEIAVKAMMEAANETKEPH